MLSSLAKYSSFSHGKALKRVRTLSLTCVAYIVERISSSWKKLMVRWRSVEQTNTTGPSRFSTESGSTEYVCHKSGSVRTHLIAEILRKWRQVPTPVNLPLSRRHSIRCYWHEDLLGGWIQCSVGMEMPISHRMRWEPILHSFSFLRLLFDLFERVRDLL